MNSTCLMTSAMAPVCSRASRDSGTRTPGDETVVTRVWLEEFQQLEVLFADQSNSSPKLRYPDLISGCVSVVFNRTEPEERIFEFLYTQLIARDQGTQRRQENMWRAQYLLLRALQVSELNSHPHPQFKLDHFTTACVALALAEPDGKLQVFEQARRNIAQRACVLHRRRHQMGQRPRG